MTTAKEKIKELELEVLRGLEPYGFKKKSHNTFERKLGECVQFVGLPEDKIRGIDEYEVMPNYGFEYAVYKKCEAYIQGRKYKKGWRTGSECLFNVIEDGEYIFRVNGSTDVNQMADWIIYNLLRYAVPLWDACETLDKFKMALGDTANNIQWNNIISEGEGWAKLIMSLIYVDDNVDDIIHEYRERFERTACVVFSECIPRIEKVKEAFKNGKGLEFLENETKANNRK